MKIRHLRNATLILEFNDSRVLVDPMLAAKGALPPFAVFRHKGIRNPTVELPDGAYEAAEQATHALITHCQKKHVDHLDSAGTKMLARTAKPVFCTAHDDAFLQAAGLTTQPLEPRGAQPFLGGHITPVRAQHGRGWIRRVMENGVGYYIDIPGHPSVYISGDTVLTDDVRAALTALKPDVAVLAAGYASMDLGKPILMPLEEMLEFIRLAPGRVLANHLEALNHCPMTRQGFAGVLHEEGLLHKVDIPADGEVVDYGERRAAA